MRSQVITAILLAASSLPAQTYTRSVSKIGFRAIGIPAAGQHTHARLRTSIDAQTWTPWQDFTTDPESGSLIWLDAPANHAEIQGLPQNTRVLLIDPGVTPRQAAAGDLAIQGRAQWCPAPFSCPKAASPSTATPTHLIVHHTASANTATDWPAVMRSFWELHVKGNGWADIGYNFLIDPTGVAWEGRGDGILGAHFSGVNTATTGISMIGTFTRQAPSKPALDKLVDLLTWQARRYNLDPYAQTLHAASRLELNVISGHRDAGLSPLASGRTECPGVALYPLLPAIREQVCRNIEGCLPAAARPNSCAAAADPCLSRYGVVNSANFYPRPVARGSIASVFGANLDNLTATVNNRPAAIAGATPNQLNLLIPANTEPGTSRLQLLDGATVKAERLIWVTETAPALYAALNHDDQTLNTPSAPVAPGRPLAIYLAGAQSNQPWTATLGPHSAETLYLGQAPGFPGLWQANITVPAAIPPGSHALTITISGVPAAPVPIEVGRPAGTEYQTVPIHRKVN